MAFIKSGHHGLFLPDAGVAFDGPVPREHEGSVFISHAHADHTPQSRKLTVFASPATADLMRARGHTGTIHPVPFGETVRLPNAEVTLYPAGHILGSAMIFVESGNGSLLYTGDCRTPPSPVTEGFSLPDRPVDELIIEATFALPLYKWEEHHILAGQIRRFAQETLEDGATPVMFCYNLGKAQEVMHILAGGGSADRNVRPFGVQIHEAGAALCRVYEKYGVDLGNWEPFNPETLAGKVLITPATSPDSPILGRVQNPRIAYISGWAALESRAQQMNADTHIPLSDHLDFFELLSVCRNLAPKHVWLTHSPNPDVALHFLELEGISAGTLVTFR